MGSMHCIQQVYPGRRPIGRLACLANSSLTMPHRIRSNREEAVHRGKLCSFRQPILAMDRELHCGWLYESCQCWNRYAIFLFNISACPISVSGSRNFGISQFVSLLYFSTTLTFSGRSYRETCTPGVTEPIGGVDQDLHTGYRVGSWVLGHGARQEFRLNVHITLAYTWIVVDEWIEVRSQAILIRIRVDRVRAASRRVLITTCHGRMGGTTPVLYRIPDIPSTPFYSQTKASWK